MKAMANEMQHVEVDLAHQKIADREKRSHSPIRDISLDRSIDPLMSISFKRNNLAVRILHEEFIGAHDSRQRTAGSYSTSQQNVRRGDMIQQKLRRST